MQKEIELKMLLPEGIDESVLARVLSQFAENVEQREFTLFNQYFDTADGQLRAHGVGLRVRSSELGIEQTVKTAGKSVGGLHQRPEYNVQINSLEPDLNLFDKDIWPDGLSANQLQEQISQVFHTDFKRQEYTLRLTDKSDIEIVLDQGSISTAQSSTPICEIELELKNGKVEELFDVAEKIAENIPTQLGNLSKAARGYLLARHQTSPEKQPLGYVNIDKHDSCESAFCKALEYSLSQWQRAEYRYMQSKKVNDLIDVYTGLRLTAQCLDVFNDGLECDDVNVLKNALSIRLRKWAWIEQLHSIKVLRSKRGMYSKRLSQHDALTSYFRGLQDGTLNLSRPHFLITQKDNVVLQLKLSRLLISKPWQTSDNQHDKPIKPFAKQQLIKKWQSVIESIRQDSDSLNGYLRNQNSLRDALLADLLVGKCLSKSKRQEFRPPWQDVLDGIEELRHLTVLQTKLQDSDVEDKSELLGWTEVKKTNLLTVIEQSKEFALAIDPYW